MQSMKRAVGPGAASRKYDILSALMAHGLAGDKHRQRLVLRMMALITTRYNWRLNELSMGHQDIARLWCVDTRTVKRDMARLKSLGWITVKRQGARGRVSLYGISFERIALDTRAQWPHVGPDFVDRMSDDGTGQGTCGDNVVPFPQPEISQEGVWGRIQHYLSEENPTLFSAWFAVLVEAGLDDATLTLYAPSKFHASYVKSHLMERLMIAARRSASGIQSVIITAP